MSTDQVILSRGSLYNVSPLHVWVSSKHANRTTNYLLNICGDTLSGVFRIISLITPLVFSVQSLPMSPL